MVVVLTVVEAYESHLHESLNLSGAWVDHPRDWFVLAEQLPVHKEQVREHLTVK